jgi:hypothetical protein
MREFSVEMGRLRATVLAPAPLIDDLRPRWDLYQTAGGSPNLVLEVESPDDHDESAGERRFDPAAAASFDGSMFRFVGDGFTIELLRGDPAHAACRCRPRALLVDNALRLCLSALAPWDNALLLHASALAWQGSGAVFTGPKGAGKSTALKLLAGHPRMCSLGDEVAIVRLADAGATVHSTPFGWKYLPVPPGAAPLSRLFCLVPPPTVLDSPARMMAHLFANVLTTAGSGGLDRILLGHVQALVERVDCRQLYRPTREELERALSV